MKKLLSSIFASTLILSTSILPTASIAAEQDQTKQVDDLAIYYGWPSAVNGAGGNVSKAVEAFKPYEVIVFGDGLEHTTHGDHAKTKQIIDGLKPTGNEVFGYISIGCEDKLANSTIKRYVDEWKDVGASGVFYDCYGFDYGVSRAKQNELVDYAHSKNLNVIANAWVPEDAMGDKNESGTVNKPKLTGEDYFLMEDWIADRGNLQSAKEWVSKADKTAALSKSTGVKVAVLATNPNPYANNVKYDQFKMVATATAAYNFDAFQWQESDHSASSAKIGLYELPKNYGTYFTDGTVVHNSDYTVMTRKTDKGQFVITQNSTKKDGEFIASSTPPTPPSNDLQKQIDELKAENIALKKENAGMAIRLSLIKNAVTEFVDKVLKIIE